MTKGIVAFCCLICFASGFISAAIGWQRKPNQSFEGSVFRLGGHINVVYWSDGKAIGRVDSCDRATLRMLLYIDSITVETAVVPPPPIPSRYF